ncbi:hypothetical protein HMN09_00862400 [Mycena chlorophos]|uniref:Uncharacterized protein n=1 Tax=Mycena chlorophos TaxID=658473 RepID=A0A8H6W7K1_MYCCL|nr:hypothetical protein HMN09_00862400 [Mycena chlorophos]
MAPSQDKSTVLAFELHTNPLGLSQDELLSQVETLIETTLDMPNAYGVTRVDLITPNDAIRREAEQLGATGDSVCVVSLWHFKGDDERVTLLTDPKFNIGAFAVDVTNYLDKSSGSSSPAHALMVINLGEHDTSESIHQQIKPLLNKFLESSGVQEHLTKCVVLEPSPQSQTPPPPPERNTLVIMMEARDTESFTTIARDGAALTEQLKPVSQESGISWTQFADKFGPLMFSADGRITKRGADGIPTRE